MPMQSAISVTRPYLVALLGVLAAFGLLPEPAEAQRPFRVFDPFYRSETARRAFFDGYAVTAEAAYRSSGSVQDGRQTVGGDPLGLSFRLDYQFLPQVDLSAVLDAAGSYTGRSLSVSWVALKYYETIEHTDYAFRLAVDPSFDGRVGFPQMDVAFISTTLLAPNLSADHAVGVRRVRMGYEQYVPGSPEEEVPSVPTTLPSGDIVYTRAMGWEVHLMMHYSFLLNPARSNVFLSFLLDYGQYDLWEASLREDGPGARMGLAEPAAGVGGAGEDDLTKEYRGGVVWLRSGFEYNRPAFQVMPFLSLPLQEWAPPASTRNQNRARISAGVRVMLR